MSLGNFFKWGWKRVRASLMTDSWEKKAFYLFQEYPQEVVFIKNAVRLLYFDCTLPKGKYLFLLIKYETLRSLRNTIDAHIEIVNGKVFIKFLDLTLTISTAEELFIIEEIFLCGVYNFHYPHKVIVLDVGMNVGFASLFFAAHSQVEAVYSFEPFHNTYQQALKNFELNPHFSFSIKPENYGLSVRDESLLVDYDYENKGQVGVLGTSLIKSEMGTTETAIIKLKEASGSINEILKLHPEAHFVLKLDCEGSEYAIFKNLAYTNLLSRFDIILVEWHENGPVEILQALSEANFKAFFQQSATKEVGMIYAFR